MGVIVTVTVNDAAAGVLVDGVDGAVAPLDDVVEGLYGFAAIGGGRVERVVVAGIVVRDADRGDAVGVDLVALEECAVGLRRERRTEIVDGDREGLFDVVDAGDARWRNCRSCCRRRGGS